MVRRISYNIIFPNDDSILIMMDEYINELDNKIFNDLNDAITYIEPLMERYSIEYKVFDRTRNNLF
jgi:hypothetical protein